MVVIRLCWKAGREYIYVQNQLGAWSFDWIWSDRRMKSELGPDGEQDKHDDKPCEQNETFICWTAEKLQKK